MSGHVSLPGNSDVMTQLRVVEQSSDATDPLLSLNGLEELHAVFDS